MKIGFVILHYKNAEETSSCINSILRMKNSHEMRIVVVDNSPQHNSGQIVKNKYWDISNVEVISSEKDTGFSRANNMGYQYIISHFELDFVVVTNNDIEFMQEDFRTRVEKIYHQTGFGVLGPDIIRAGTGGHQSPIDLRLRTKEEAEATIKKNKAALKFFNILFPILSLLVNCMDRNKDNSLSINYEKRYEKVVLQGACLIFSKKFIECCEKAFYPETDFFYEEYILAYRCEKLGLRMLYHPTIKVRHEGGAATKQSYKNTKKRLSFVLENTMKGCQVYLDYIRK